MITGAFLAETAAVVNNKLDVSGGVLAGYTVGPDRTARLVLVVLTQQEIGGSTRQVDVEIRPPDGGEPQQMTYHLPDAAAGGEIGFAFFSVEVDLPCDGRWVFVVTGGPGAVSLPLQVAS